MQKTLRNKNIVTLYIREKYKDMWELFVKEVEKDPNFNDIRYRNHNVVSVAIVNLVYKYLLDKGVIQKDETSN